MWRQHVLQKCQVPDAKVPQKNITFLMLHFDLNITLDRLAAFCPSSPTAVYSR